jgi:hypothetical protein
MLFAPSGELISVNDDALVWLEELPPDWIDRGHSTAEIARRLFRSAHTVRGYVKAIFEKVGVSTRGELVAKIFTEHYAPAHLRPDSHGAVET